MLPYWYRYPGYFLLITGICITILYLWMDIRIMSTVFALFSCFIEIKTFTLIRTNITDELFMISLISGLGLIIFSKEKKEQKRFITFRYRALFRAFLWNTIFLIFSILFIFGNGFLFILILNLVSVSILYLWFFYRSLFREKHK